MNRYLRILLPAPRRAGLRPPGEHRSLGRDHAGTAVPLPGEGHHQHGQRRGGVPGNDNVSIWLDPALFVDETSLGVPYFEVEDYSLFDSNGLQSLTFEGSNITGAGVRFDELHLGTTLADVAAAVPEPSTLALLVLGLLAFAPLARRRAEREVT